MNSSELEARLKEALRRLEECSLKIIKTRGYTSEVEKVRILEELIKEQLKNENISSAARATR